MSRRLRIRSLSDDELNELLDSAIVECLTSQDDSATAELAVQVERLHREWLRRHRKSAAEGCICRECFYGRQGQLL